MGTWTTPITWVTGDIVTATNLNQQLSDNMEYLHNRPAQVVKYTGGDFTTSSSTFTDVDTTHASVSLTLSGDKVWVGMQGHIKLSANAQVVHLDIAIDGARYGGTATDGRGLVTTAERTLGISANDIIPVGFNLLLKDLSIGSHTFSLVWRTSAGTATLFASANTNVSYPFTFWAKEV